MAGRLKVFLAPSLSSLPTPISSRQVTVAAVLFLLSVRLSACSLLPLSARLLMSKIGFAGSLPAFLATLLMRAGAAAACPSSASSCAILSATSAYSAVIEAVAVSPAAVPASASDGDSFTVLSLSANCSSSSSNTIPGNTSSDSSIL